MKKQQLFNRYVIIIFLTFISFVLPKFILAQQPDTTNVGLYFSFTNKRSPDITIDKCKGQKGAGSVTNPNPLFKYDIYVNSVLYCSGCTSISNIVDDCVSYAVCTDTAGKISRTNTLTFIFHDLPKPIINSKSDKICENDILDLSTQYAASYLWSTGATSENIVVTNPGNYSVKVKDQYGCEGQSEVKTITVKNVPKPVINFDGKTTICEGDKIDLTSTPSKYYIWSDGSQTQKITVNKSGNYFVKVIDEDGCNKTSDDINIEVKDVASVSIYPKYVGVCQGFSFDVEPLFITFIKKPLFNWNTGETTQKINISKSGSYIVKVTDDNGCVSVSDPLNVTVWPLPIRDVVAKSKTILCPGESVILEAVNFSSYSYEWYNGKNFISNLNSYLKVTKPGVYRAKIRQLGCEVISDSIVVTSSPNPNIQFQLNDSIVNDSKPIILSAVPAGGVFEGNGVIANTFYPEKVNPGKSLINYKFKDQNNCLWNKSASTYLYSKGQLLLTDIKADYKLIYPNPSNGTFTIQGAPEGSYLIVNELGEEVYQFQINEHEMSRFDLDFLNQGVYYIKNKHVPMISQKLIVIN